MIITPGTPKVNPLIPPRNDIPRLPNVLFSHPLPKVERFRLRVASDSGSLPSNAME